jgi:hypothetical protein
MWQSGWILHQDNALVHNEFWVQQFLVKEQVPALSHIPYAPDLILCDYYFFQNFKCFVNFLIPLRASRKKERKKGLLQNDF